MSLKDEPEEKSPKYVKEDMSLVPEDLEGFKPIVKWTGEVARVVIKEEFPVKVEKTVTEEDADADRDTVSGFQPISSPAVAELDDWFRAEYY